MFNVYNDNDDDDDASGGGFFKKFREFNSKYGLEEDPPQPARVNIQPNINFPRRVTKIVLFFFSAVHSTSMPFASRIWCGSNFSKFMKSAMRNRYMG